MSENFDDVTYGPITLERAKHHCKCLAVDCEWRATEIESFISAQEKLLADFARHLLNIQQDICENAFVEVSIYDAVKQALSEVAPDHSALRNEPPNYGVWENQRKRIDELEAANAELEEALEDKKQFLDFSNTVAAYDHLIANEIDQERIKLLECLRANWMEDNK